MFGRIIICASLAGVVAALLLTLAQTLWITPLLLQAEIYEDSQELPASVTHNAPSVNEQGGWQPDNGWQRTLATMVSNGVLGTGYGLMLVGLYRLRRPLDIKQGLWWGLAGYTVFFVAPSLGLPPELPGTVAADLMARQYWWLATVVATAAGLGLLCLQQRRGLRIVGVLLLVAPHGIGAPQPQMFFSLAPEILQIEFRLATLVCNALFWLALGLVSAGLFQRLFNYSTDSNNG